MILALAAGAAKAPIVAQDTTAAPAAPAPRAHVVFGTDRDYPPFEYFDAAGQPTGFNVALVKALGEELGWDVEVRLDEWPRIRHGLEVEHTVDFADMFRNPTRTTALDFSEPFAVVHFEIFLRRDSPPVNSLEDLRGRSVIVQDSAIVQEYLLRLDPSVRIITAASEPEALRWLAAGKYDCAIVGQLAGRYTIQRDNLPNLVSSGVPVLPVEYCFAMVSGRTELRTQLNRGLRALRASGRYDQLHEQWFGGLLGHRATFRDVLRYAAWILGPLAAVALAATLWSFALRRTIARRTRELRAELAAHARAEKEMRESRQQYADLVGSLPLGVYRMNRKGTAVAFVYLSDRWAELTGLDRAAVMADSRLAFTPVHPEDLPSLVARNDAVQRTLERFQWEGRMFVRGETHWMHLESTPSPLPDGTVQWTGILADITEQHRTAEALRSSERKFAAAFNSSPDAILISEPDSGRIVEVNDACTRITGFSRSELIGHSALEVGLWNEQRQHEQFLTQLRDHGHVPETEAGVRTKSGVIRDGLVSGDLIEIEGRHHVLVIIRDITERKRAEHALALFQYSIDQSTDSVFWLTRDAKFSYVNEQACRTLGYSRDELLALSLWDIDPVYPRSAWEKTWREGNRDRRGGGHIETTHRRRDGSTIPVEIVSNHIWYGNEELHIAVARDLTEKKQAEERYRSIIQTAIDGFWILDSAGRLMVVNDAVCRMLGYTRDELLTRSIPDLEANEDPTAVVAHLEQIARSGLDRFETKLKKKDGSVVAAEISINHLPGPDRRFFVFIRDITERKEREAALRRSEERFRLVTERTGQLVYDFDLATGRAEWFGDAGAMLGYSGETINSEGLGWWTGRIHPDDRTAVAEGWRQTIDHGTPQRTVYRFRRADGTWAHLMNSCVRLDASAGRPARVLGAVADITPQQEAAEAIRRLNAELEQRVRERTADLDRTAARLQETNASLLAANDELESFSYSVSHDLRAPLRNIAGFIELLRRRTAGLLDNEADRYFGIIGTEAVRMAALIDDLLTFSRLGRTELHSAPVELGTLVGEVRNELHPELAGREIEWRIAPLPVVQGDRTLLRQVVANLLGNSVKFTRHRQPARIEIGVEPGSTGTDLRTFFIRDNGAGFDPKYAAKLFGVFQRLHNPRDFEGTGIGLANVKRIIERHGGRVWAEGRPEEGATFFFTLPVCHAPEEAR